MLCILANFDEMNLNKLPISDLQQIAKFNRIIKNYLRIKRLFEKL